MLHILLASTNAQTRRGLVNIGQSPRVKVMLPSAASAENATVVYNVG